MKTALSKILMILVFGTILIGCQAANISEGDPADGNNSPKAIEPVDENDTHEHVGHNHDHDEEDEQIYEGHFEDSQVKGRLLSDWEGDWQSVYAYLLDGTLDEVFEHKAEHEGERTFDEYKEYYEKGYKTEIERIVIEGKKVTFFRNGVGSSGEYISDGYEILIYDSGNKGVRYIFKLAKETDGLPKYLQFSDHSIYPTESGHYHLYWGDNREALLEEVDNWPTYYPYDMNGHDIAHGMIEH